MTQYGKPALEDPPQSDLFRLLVDSFQEYALFLLNARGEVSSWNIGAQRLMGYAPEEVIGKHFRVFYPLASQNIGKPEYELQVAARVGRFEDEGWRIRKDGPKFWANAVISALRDDSGELLGFGQITRDLTSRMETQQRYRLLVDSVTDYAIYLLDRDGRITSWNAGAEKIKQYTEAEVIGQHFSKFYTPEEAERGVPQRALQIAAEQGHYRAEGWRVKKDGSRFWSSVVITPLFNEEAALVGFSKITRDITDRKILFDQLQQRTSDLQTAEKGLRHLSQRLMQAQDSQRRRLARELHDGTGQILVAVNMNLQVLQQQARSLTPIMAQRLNESIDLLDRAIREMRTTSYLLHPPMLDEVGLNAALRWLSEGFNETSGIDLTIELPSHERRLPPEIETAVFRIVQEGLDNVQKHSRGSSARVQLTFDSEHVVVSIADNGLGMGSTSPQENENRGAGISGIRERVGQLGGEFELLTGEHGSTLTARFPLTGNKSEGIDRLDF